MSKILNRETNTITIATFHENYQLKKYNFEPNYQRQSVWSEEKQSFLIDSILKNFPIPPIFLHQKIDDSTGKTVYDVIDGKQRLLSIINFIENAIPASDNSDEPDKNSFYDKRVDGIFFRELDNQELSDYKKKFWRYALPIEYIDTTEQSIIDNIFDRLNRNGEPLTGQELRKSSYNGSPILKLVEELASTEFWIDRLKNVDVARMEHYEFISEILFQSIEERPLHATQKELDTLYKKYAKSDLQWNDVKHKFMQITEYMESLDIKYEDFKVSGVSHLYGIWCLSHQCLNEKIPSNKVSAKLLNFFSELRSKEKSGQEVEIYKKSMSARTKDEGQRKRRLKALYDYVIK